MHPQEVGIRFAYNGYRFNVCDDRAIHIREYVDCYLVHWEWYNAATDLIDHGLVDAKGEWLLVNAGIFAFVNAVGAPAGKRGEAALAGAFAGAGFGLALGVLRAISDRRQGKGIEQWH